MELLVKLIIMVASIILGLWVMYAVYLFVGFIRRLF